ncbi:MAG: hypothetical protein DMF64_05215 [Acidobacteria bacterium]|nr:MAG: hypothetical protein DMF64_05215 [Acidobacteriota bacterium]
MSIPKLCLRLAVFLCTLTIALFVTRLFLIPPRVEVRVAAPTLPPAPVVKPTPAQVNFKVQQVVLDRAHKKTYVQLIVERNPQAPTPDHLWVALTLYTQNKSDVWFYGWEYVPQPFAQGDRATQTVVFSRSYTYVADNYYAQVSVTTQNGEDDNPLKRFNDSFISTAAPVIVEHEQKR